MPPLVGNRPESAIFRNQLASVSTSVMKMDEGDRFESQGFNLGTIRILHFIQILFVDTVFQLEIEIDRFRIVF